MLFRSWTTNTWGSFWDTTATQTLTNANNEAVVTFNNSDPANSGVSVVSSSRITFAKSCVYNLQFSAVFIHDGGAKADVEVWFRINGADVPWSNTIFTVDKAAPFVAAWNFVTSLGAGDSVQIMWYSAEASLSIDASPAGVRPAIPSIILTVDQMR